MPLPTNNYVSLCYLQFMENIPVLSEWFLCHGGWSRIVEKYLSIDLYFKHF